MIAGGPARYCPGFSWVKRPAYYFSTSGPRLGPRFRDVLLFAHHDGAGVGEVMHPASPQAHGLEPELAVDAHGALLLVVPAGAAPALLGYRPSALLLDEGTVDGASSADRTPGHRHVTTMLYH